MNINLCVYIAWYLHGTYGRLPKYHSVFSGRDPGTLKSDIVSTKTSTINLLGFETLKLKFRRLKLWKPTVPVSEEKQTQCSPAAETALQPLIGALKANIPKSLLLQSTVFFHRHHNNLEALKPWWRKLW